MTQQLRVLGAWLAGLGFVWTGVAALASGQYVPNWFDPDDGPCAVDPEGVCAAGLRQQWWWAGVGGLLTLVGVALVVWSLDRAAADAPPRQLPGVAHALLAAALSPALFVLLTVPALFLLLVTGTSHGLVLVGLVAWLVEAPLLAALDQAVGEGGTSSRSRHAGALVVSGVAVGVTLAEQVRDLGHLDAAQVLRHAAVVGLGVLLLRFLAVPGAARARLLGAVAGAAAVLAVGALVLVPVLHRPAADSAARREADPLPAPPSAAAPTPTATPVPAPVPVPEPTPTPTPTPVVADAPCAQQDLTFRVEGFDAAMGARAAALVATNTGSAPCWLEGVPVVVLMQGGRPLALQVGEGQTPEGGPARTERVGVAPGGTAVSLLSWRSYGGWADLDTPQSVTVALDASTTLVSAAVSGGGGAAPFDIADGGAWGIAPWAAPAG